AVPPPAAARPAGARRRPALAAAAGVLALAGRVRAPGRGVRHRDRREGGRVMGDDILITEAEWQAALIGARLLREAWKDFRALGNHEIAAECDGQADALEGLARRAVVAASREHEVACDIADDLEAER